MNKHLRRGCALAAVLAAGGLAGCSVFTPRQDPSQFYTLSALPQSDAPATPIAPAAAIGVFSPQLPNYTDRPQIVSRVAGEQVFINDFARWAEPLDDAFARVLVADLALLTGTNRVAVFPLTRAFTQELDVYVVVVDLVGIPGGEVTLNARWRIASPGGRPNYVEKSAIYKRTAAATPNPYQGYVEAMSLLVGDMAKEIAAAVPEAQAAEEARRAADATKTAAADNVPTGAGGVPPPPPPRTPPTVIIPVPAN